MISEATAVHGSFGFYNRADRAASYPDCNGHMRNRKLKSTLEEQMAERRLLDKICADFTAVYYVELNTGSFEILHINDGTNAKKPNPNQHEFFETQAVKIYEDETRLSNEMLPMFYVQYVVSVIPRDVKRILTLLRKR